MPFPVQPVTVTVLVISPVPLTTALQPPLLVPIKLTSLFVSDTVSASEYKTVYVTELAALAVDFEGTLNVTVGTISGAVDIGTPEENGDPAVQPLSKTKFKVTKKRRFILDILVMVFSSCFIVKVPGVTSVSRMRRPGSKLRESKTPSLNPETLPKLLESLCYIYDFRRISTVPIYPKVKEILASLRNGLVEQCKYNLEAAHLEVSKFIAMAAAEKDKNGQKGNFIAIAKMLDLKTKLHGLQVLQIKFEPINIAGAIEVAAARVASANRALVATAEPALIDVTSSMKNEDDSIF